MIEHTIQLDLFNDSKESKKAGRPPQIAKEIVFAVKDDLNRGLSNKSIIKKHDIKERTFFRIKKGDYFYHSMMQKLWYGNNFAWLDDDEIKEGDRKSVV